MTNAVPLINKAMEAIVFGPGKYTEAEVLVGYLDAQLTALRAAAFGLSDDQARATPCRSTLSVGGLIKHATYVMRQREGERAKSGAMPDETDFALFVGSFALTDDETIESVLAHFDEVRDGYLAGLRATDPGAEMVAPPTPWEGIFEPTDSVQRFYIVHHVEELARHAGHADIIREQLDGASAAELLMAAEGRPGNDFIQPWKPS